MSDRPSASTAPAPPRTPDVVREVEAFVFTPGRGTAPSHHAVLAVTEHDDGSWAVELNPTEDRCAGILYLPPGSTAGDALGGLLAMVSGRPVPPLDPGPEIAVGPTYGGLGLLVLHEGTDGEYNIRGEVKVAKINGTWAIVAADPAIREGLERVKPRTTPAPAAS